MGLIANTSTSTRLLARSDITIPEGWDPCGGPHGPGLDFLLLRKCVR